MLHANCAAACGAWDIQICCMQERARYEAQAMAEEYAHCPQHVPKLHLYDADMALIVMQYLEPPHNILRQASQAVAEARFALVHCRAQSRHLKEGWRHGIC